MRYLIAGLLTMTLAGCQSNQLASYTQNMPQLDPRTFFDGKLCAHGVVKNYGGKVIRTMNAQILASWQIQAGVNVGTLDEVFLFTDIATNKQSRETRIWTLKSQPQPNSYIASASDVVGETLLRHSGNAINMNYTLRYAQPDKQDSQGKPKTIDLQMRDWMYLVSPNTIINTTSMHKFGLKVGEVVLTIQKVADDAACF